MDFIISPIADWPTTGETACCDPSLRRTAAKLTGDAVSIGTSAWRIFESDIDEYDQSGDVEFHICCAARITVRVYGTLADYDHFMIDLFFPSESIADHYAPVGGEAYDHTFEIDLLADVVGNEGRGRKFMIYAGASASWFADAVLNVEIVSIQYASEL